MVATQKFTETGRSLEYLYAGYTQGVASTLVLAALLEDEQRAKCGGVVDDPYIKSKRQTLV
jgi:hypothetical protein